MAQRSTPPASGWTPADGFPDILAVLDQALAAAHWRSALMGGPRFPPAERGDPPVGCQPHPRLTIVLDGCMRYGSSCRGERVITDCRAGAVCYWATHGWNLDFWGTPTAALGMVFRPGFVRVLRFRHPGGALPVGPARIAHHTRAPLPAAGRQLLASLDALTDLGPPAELRLVAGDLLRGLLGMVRAHVAADLAGGPGDGALRTWQEAMQFIAEHLQEGLSREAVAAAMGLHPNYLSALFTRHGGSSFHRTIEGLRIDRARALLGSDPGRRIAEVARHCGFADAGHFIRVFKRRTGRTPGRFARR
jgi:AraC-like DNA-binding protein